jgi:hypothetical protein
MKCATMSLPVPLSPSTSTGLATSARRVATRSSSFMAGAPATMRDRASEATVLIR